MFATSTTSTPWLRFIFGATLFVISMMAHSHEKVPEDGLLLHYAAGTHAIIANSIEDLAAHHPAVIHGGVTSQPIAPTEAFEFNGQTGWIEISTDLATATGKIPETAFTVTAWVNLLSTTTWGGIFGMVQDDGPVEYGWLLGYDQTAFTFAVSSLGADDGDGKLTYLRAQDPIEINRWAHLAGVYDGKVMTIWVNGKKQGESREQTGALHMPSRSPLVLGAYKDGNEFNPMHGALFEAKLYNRVLSPQEIEGMVRKNANLLSAPPRLSGAPPAWLVMPFLQMQRPTEITVISETAEPSRMTIRYGKRQPLTLSASSEVATRIAAVSLTGLEPGVTYFYEVERTDTSGRSIVSPVATLRGAPGPTEAWAFGIIGDTQRNPAVTKACADGLFALRPTMLIHCGDVVDDGFAKNQWQNDFFTPMSALIAHVPINPVLGNHEKNAPWYYDYFHLPPPEYYYTFTHGNAQFFMIDSNKPCLPGSEQYQWLEKELAASKAPWKFTVHHHPCFTSDEDDYGDTRQGKGKEPTWGDANVRNLVPLYEKYAVDISFNGHIHVYERTWPIRSMQVNPELGVRYITSGGGGGHLEQAAPQRTWFSHHFHRAHHYCIAAVLQNKITFKAYDIEGRMFDHFELSK